MGKLHDEARVALCAAFAVLALSCKKDGAGNATGSGPGTAAGEGEKVVLCHFPPGNPDRGHTIEVRESAVREHLDQGDHLGPCAGDCTAADHPCRADAECCSEDCEDGTCNLDCRANAEACELSGQCCSKTCADGVCVRPCRVSKHRCTSGTDCCSGVCSKGKCATI